MPSPEFVFYVGLFIYLLLLIGVVVFAVMHIRGLNSIAAQIEHGTRVRAQNAATAAQPEIDQTALRLQACERLALLLERIAVPNLLLRHAPEVGKNARVYTAELLLAVRQEVEYNVTQQIYVSDALWSIIGQARDNIGMLISRAAEGTDTSQEVANRLRALMGRQENDPIALAQSAVRREAAGMLVK